MKQHNQKTEVRIKANLCLLIIVMLFYGIVSYIDAYCFIVIENMN